MVEGDTYFDDDTTVEGIIYMPNSGTLIYNDEDDDSQINGGIVTWGGIDGKGYQINVDYDPAYFQALVDYYAPNNPSFRMLSWK